MTTFILLSDVTELDGPTKLVPLEHTRDLPLIPGSSRWASSSTRRSAATAPAGSLMIYKTDVLHRGSDFGAPGRSRFVMLVDFQQRGWRWNGKMSWPDHAEKPGFVEAMVRMTPAPARPVRLAAGRQRLLDAQTLRDVAARYPGMDMTPYEAGVAAPASAP